MKDALVGNASDKKQVERARQQEALSAENRDARFKRLMQNPDFRAFAWELLGKTRVFETIMETNARIYYNAGQQDIGHWIQGEAVRLAPDEYLTMIQENRTDA
jgi:hypothetical protein